MDTQRIHADGPPADQMLVLRLMEAIGSTEFAARVLESVSAFVPINHCTIFALKSNGRMEALASASAIGEVATITAVDYLRLGFDKLDANTRWLSKRKATRQTQYWIGHQLARDIENDQYRRLCYDDAGIRERASLLTIAPNGYRAAISFYRNHSRSAYSAHDMAWLAAQAPVLAAATMRHVRLFPQSLTHRMSEQELLSSLSYRERQIIAHIVEGLTNKEAAEQMGVSVTTAATYRYRAFGHLGVSSVSELFALLRNPRVRR